ncbi:MAG: DHA2 family efflux MFS transporter permease subunit [Propionibacteriales bacterium]|nr:DHA2 family efflux MFS transporter permease subunit [Propionibacteriales bacterium]
MTDTFEASSAERSRWAALVVLCVGMLMMVLDATVVNVALPAIKDDLGFSQSGLAWVVNGYLISFGGLLLLSGRLGDLIGRRDVFLGGLVLFSTASLACGLAQDQSVLVAARFIQGCGGALTSAVILGMIVTLFPEPSEQARAIGVFSFVASAGGSIGLLAGGVITQLVSWHWIFFINLPIGVATAVAARKYVVRDRGIGLAKGADVPGAVFVTSALMLAVYTIVSPAATYGWGAGRTLVFGAASVALLVAFVVREATCAQPLVPLGIFRSRNVTGANVIQALTVAGMFGMFFLGVLYLQQVKGYDALQTGLAYLPCTIVMAVLSVRYTERLAMRFGARTVLVPGLAMIAVGLGLFARVPVDGTYLVDVMPSALFMGAGVGISFPALMMLSMSGVRPEDAGLASGLVNTTCQVGAALGLAVLATLSTARTETLSRAGRPVKEALVGGYQRGFVVGTVLVLVALGVALAVIRNPQQPAVQADAQAEVDDDLDAELAVA